MDDGITVSGTGQASAAPDVVRISLTITHDARDVAAALSGVGERVLAVSRAARQRGVEDRDIVSAGAGVYPQYADGGMGVVGYRASHQLLVSCRDLQRTDELVGAVADAAGNALSLDRLGLELADPRELQAQARDAAYRDAQAKGEQLARLSGRSLGDVLAVSEHGADEASPRPAMAAMRMAATTDAMPVQPGETTVRVQVIVRFALGPQA